MDIKRFLTSASGLLNKKFNQKLTIPMVGQGGLSYCTEILCLYISIRSLHTKIYIDILKSSDHNIQFNHIKHKINGNK